ncbi:MAG: bifunctional hydroxymethylpyrimidine kinase/phosphomethylpyrimidine kinase [Desulfovibrionaceae bacterium]|nr:bifunctional hydroxymethylpyrimidine kinase/phosphomethylpyrimidine kinase [Desulfovibrionaceae bacterium]
MSYPNILSIAGSDSGGGAGIQADLKTVTVLGGFGLSVITALTAQNGVRVRGIQAVPPEFVLSQYETLREGFRISAAKTGMLCNRDIMLALAPRLRQRDFPLVVDPVCVSQSGHALLESDALDTLRTEILPLADLLTPNLPEAEALTGLVIDGPEAAEAACRALRGMGASAVLLKGGHCVFSPPGQATDWLCLEEGVPLLSLTHERVPTPNNHGTGCALSAAIAVFIGLGAGVEEAVARAREFLLAGLKRSFTPGLGAGPINFMAGAEYELGRVRWS